MISKEEIKKLADLARIGITDKEAESLKEDMASILEYVSQVKSVGMPSPEQAEGEAEVRNVFREDENPTPSGTYSGELIAEFPQREGDYLKVKKIL